MTKPFRPYSLDQQLLLPPDLRSWLPEGDLALFVSDVGCEGKTPHRRPPCLRSRFGTTKRWAQRRSLRDGMPLGKILFVQATCPGSRSRWRAVCAHVPVGP